MKSQQQLNRVLLRDHLIFTFTEKEFRAFITKLDISYDDLRGNTQRDRATVLIGKMERLNQLQRVVAALVKERPSLASAYWDYLQAEKTPEPTDEDRLDWLHNANMPNEEPPTMKWNSEPKIDRSEDE
ncbi:MAG: hypothetical protein GY943_07165 [Chloroflexi bacterium]|nr:hypothetical protein [Chloroflexota bacterium]